MSYPILYFFLVKSVPPISMTCAYRIGASQIETKCFFFLKSYYIQETIIIPSPNNSCEKSFAFIFLMYNMSSSHTHLPATTSTIQLQLCYEVFCFGGGRFVFSTTFSHQKRTELRENFITICLDFYQILYRYFKPMMVFYSIFLAILQ